MARDERRRARGRGLGRDHAERLGEDRRHDGRVGERQQVHEVTVLERAGEERARRRGRLELSAIRPEADDDEPRVDPLHRLEQHLHALLLDQLAEVDDERARLGRGTQRAGRRCRRRAGARRRRSADRPAPRRAGLRAPLGGPAARTRRCRRPAAPRRRGRRGRRPLRAPRGCAPSRRRSPPPCASASLAHSPSSGRPRIEYSSSEPCALTRNGAPLAAPTGPPISTWFANTRSAGSSSRSTAAFASTYARRSASVKSWRNFGSRPS